MSSAIDTLPLQRRAVSAPSFAEAAERHLDDVYRYLLVFTRDATAAEDLAAETFERALRSWRRFDARRASARTWLCAIARNVALDHFRAEQRRRTREDAAADARYAEEPPDLGLSPQLEAALAQLSAADRELVALRVVLDVDTKTAARLLGVSESACTTRLNRALSRLEELMTDDE